MLAGGLKACLLLHVEPALDVADPPAALAALAGMDLVVALSAFKSAALGSADVLLPIAPFTETSGTFVNAEGRVQGFHGVVKPLGDARPAWKALRVLANMLGLAGFDFETSDEVRNEALGDLGSLPARLGAGVHADLSGIVPAPVAAGALERIADVPIYATDALVRRAPALQHTADARPALASVSPVVAARLGLTGGQSVKVGRGTASVTLPLTLDAGLPDGVVRVPAGLAATAPLGAAFGPLSIEKA